MVSKIATKITQDRNENIFVNKNLDVKSVATYRYGI
jgi:hypothetical protein